MANVTIERLLEAQRQRVLTVADVGQVLTRERYVSGDAFLRLFISLNHDRLPKGVMILFQELIEQRKGPRVCTVQKRARFSYEIFHPFVENDEKEVTSYDEFLVKIQAVNDAINLVEPNTLPWNLDITDLGADVEHQFLQGDGVMDTRVWGTGSTAIKTHYISMTLDVLYVTSTHGNAMS
jgi:hypothetical protein